MTWTSDTVVSKLYETVNATRRLDVQRLEQWLSVLRGRPADEAFEALIGVFCNEGRQNRNHLDQEYAGRLLLALKLPCPLDVQGVIKRALPTWDLSVEQFPWYFEAAMVVTPSYRLWICWARKLVPNKCEGQLKLFVFGFVLVVTRSWRKIAITLTMPDRVSAWMVGNPEVVERCLSITIVGTLEHA